MSDEILKDLALHSFRARLKREIQTHRHLPLAILPNKRKCCCTPDTCTCKKPVDKPTEPDKVSGK